MMAAYQTTTTNMTSDNNYEDDKAIFRAVPDHYLGSQPAGDGQGTRSRLWAGIQGEH
jgi:hypothetical protein